jgi:hypothetical protein
VHIERITSAPRKNSFREEGEKSGQRETEIYMSVCKSPILDVDSLSYGVRLKTKLIFPVKLLDDNVNRFGIPVPA